MGSLEEVSWVRTRFQIRVVVLDSSTREQGGRIFQCRFSPLFFGMYDYTPRCRAREDTRLDWSLLVCRTLCSTDIIWLGRGAPLWAWTLAIIRWGFGSSKVRS